MKLKRKIIKSEFDALNAEIQKLYTQSGDDYLLDIEDTAFDELKKEKAELKKELEEYKAEEDERIRKAEERARKKAEEEYNKAKTDKDVDAIEKSWSDKYDKLKAEKDQLETKHTDYVKKALIETAVAKMASEISTSPTLISPHIRSRLDVDFSGEEPKLIVLDTKGQRSAETVEELQKSFVDNKDFSAIIKVTSASGGAKAGSSASGTHDQEKTKRLGELSDAELAEIAKARYNTEQE